MVRPGSAKALSRVRFPPSPLFPTQGIDNEVAPSDSKGYNFETAHESETQADLEAMPKVPHTILRNGVYYLNFRNPERLVPAGLAKSHFKKSLKTKNRQEAKSGANHEVALRQAEKDRLLRELDGESELHERANGGNGSVQRKSRFRVERTVRRDRSRRSRSIRRNRAVGTYRVGEGVPKVPRAKRHHLRSR